MYTYYTNTDGLYRNLDDITVVMGEHDMLVNDVDWSRYLSNDELWELFVEKYKTTELVKFFEENKSTIEITSTKDTLKIVHSDDTNSWTTNFTYKNGILTYIPSNDKTSMMVEGIWVSNAIYALADLYGYDIEKVNEWAEENTNNKLTLEKDGIEFELINIKEEANSPGITSSMEVETYSSFKLDVAKGLKYFNELKKEDVKEESKSEEKVNNPNTGINLGFGILTLILIISTIGYFLIRKQSKFPKHN